jgi:hypothetical protein
VRSDHPGGRARVHDDRRRTQCEAADLDWTSRGWDGEAAKLTHEAGVNRLMLALQLAFWRTHQLGLSVIRGGRRHCFGRRDRRDRSVVKHGFRDFAARLAAGRIPPRLFRSQDNQWRLRAFP